MQIFLWGVGARASDRLFATMGTGPAGLLGTLLRTNS